jgi:hypothetical protein
LYTLLRLELTQLEQRCADENWPLPLRRELQELRQAFGGSRLIEDRDPDWGPLGCRKCRGNMTMLEIYVINHNDPERMIVHLFPDGSPENFCGDGVALSCIQTARNGAGFSDYAVTLGQADRHTQGVVFALRCQQCGTHDAFEIRFEADRGTRFYWTDWQHPRPEAVPPVDPEDEPPVDPDLRREQLWARFGRRQEEEPQ